MGQFWDDAGRSGTVDKPTLDRVLLIFDKQRNVLHPHSTWEHCLPNLLLAKHVVGVHEPTVIYKCVSAVRPSTCVDKSF